jgi:hypothetical protein
MAGYAGLPKELAQMARDLGIHLDDWSMRAWSRTGARSGERLLEIIEAMQADLTRLRSQIEAEARETPGCGR